MSWVITGSEKTPVDPQFGSVSLLLHGNLVTTTTNIVDNSPTPKIVTPVGNAQISTAIANQFGNTTGVIAFDGNGDRLSVPLIELNGNFTLETFIRLNDTADCIAFGGESIFTQWMRFNQAGTPGRFDSYLNSQTVFGNISSGIVINTWYHIAIVRSSTTFYLFINGTQVAINSSPPAGTTGRLTLQWIGDVSNNNFHPVNGYIDELRVTNVARYTANFTPPAAPFPDI